MDIRDLIGRADLPEPVKKNSLAAFERIARAESTIHGKEIETVHFHEIGGIDSLVDIIGSFLGVDYLGIKDLMSLGVKFYSGINQRLAKPEVYQDLPVSVEGKKILLFDDVADTGESLVFASEYLMKQGAKEVKTATLFYKERSAIRPDYFGAITAAWIIFPFEIREMMALLGENWREQGKSEADIHARFEKLNFKKIITKYFRK